MQVTEKQFKRFSELVYRECGINLHEGKKQLLTARLSKRLRQTQINSIEAYLRLLENDPRELIDFVDAISTNHTFFFREQHHFETLTADHLQIWCAAASSGEEPYSIAIYCLQKGFKPTILASDISTKVLRIAEKGIYPAEKTKDLSPETLKRFFQKGNGKWGGYVRLKDEVRRMVTFKRFNLISSPLPSQVFDVIFCRNVLIYFDNDMKLEVVRKLFPGVKRGGYFIIGGAESLNNIPHGYQYVRPSIYRKKADF